jgi:hypothetical protein
MSAGRKGVFTKKELQEKTVRELLTLAREEGVGTASRRKADIIEALLRSARARGKRPRGKKSSSPVGAARQATEVTASSPAAGRPKGKKVPRPSPKPADVSPATGPLGRPAASAAEKPESSGRRSKPEGPGPERGSERDDAAPVSSPPVRPEELDGVNEAFSGPPYAAGAMPPWAPEPVKPEPPGPPPPPPAAKAKAGVYVFAVDPSRLFAWWELPEGRPGSERLTLRLYDVTGADYRLFQKGSYKDVDVSPGERSAYLPVEPGRSYRVALGLREAGRGFALLAVSEAIAAPGEGPSEEEAVLPEEFLRYRPGPSSS